jgi:hypothetical protein
MAVNAYTYGEVSGVSRRVGWVVGRGREFTGNTVPTDLDVELLLDQVASEIHATLADNGYPINTKAAMTTASAQASPFLQRVNEDGAAAELLMTFAVAGDPEDTSPKPHTFYRKRYERGLELLKGAFLESAGVSRSTSLSNNLDSGSWKDSSGNEKLPVFTRDMSDFPGSRSLIE